MIRALCPLSAIPFVTPTGARQKSVICQSSLTACVNGLAYHVTLLFQAWCYVGTAVTKKTAYAQHLFCIEFNFNFLRNFTESTVI